MRCLIIVLHLLCSPAKDSIPFPYPIENPEHPFKWAQVELKLPKKYKDSIITHDFSKMDTFFAGKEYIRSKEFLNSFHFVNLNGDSLPDIIYEGWSGGEGIMIDMFLNEGKRFKGVFSGSQHIVEMNYISDRLSSFITYDQGCCDPTVEFDRHFDVDTGFHCRLTRQRAIIAGSHIGESGYTTPDGFFDKPIRFKTLNDHYALRYAPVITGKKPDVDFDEETKGNIIAEYYKDYEGTAWAYKKDSTGREWWLVEMDPTFALEYNLFYDDNDQHTNYFGWMSSRFVEKLP